MSPADQGVIFTAPCLRLVKSIADDSCCPELIDRQLLHRSWLSCGQNDFAAHVFASVVALGSSVSNVYQIGSDVGAFTVFCQRDGHGFIAGHEGCWFPRIAFFLQFPKFGKIRVPGHARTLCAIEDLSIRRKLEDSDIAQAVSTCAFCY